MNIEQRAREQVARLVVGQPRPPLDCIEAMMAAFMPPDGRDITGAQLAAQIAQYAVKLERLAVALAAEVIRTEDAEKSKKSIPDGIGKESL